jgi:hypothetical protein
MKKWLLVMVMLGVMAPALSFSANIAPRVQKSLDALREAGLDSSRIRSLTKRMIEAGVPTEVIVRVHQALLETRRQGLDIAPVIQKAREGLAKNVLDARLPEAMDQVRSRQETAERIGRSIEPHDNRWRERISQAVYDSLAAGLTRDDVDLLLDKLRQRSQNSDRKQIHPLAEETFAATRDLTRRGVRSQTAVQVAVRALDSGYGANDLMALRKAFNQKAQTGRADELAGNWASAIRKGIGVQEATTTGSADGSGKGGHGSDSAGGGSGGRGSDGDSDGQGGGGQGGRNGAGQGAGNGGAGSNGNGGQGRY